MKKIIFSLSVFILLFSLFLVVGCEFFYLLPTLYRYEVTGDSESYHITLKNADDNMQEFDVNRSGIWWYEWEQTGTRSLYIKAQDKTSSGSVTVRIVKDGKTVKENTDVGTATVSGTY